MTWTVILYCTLHVRYLVYGYRYRVLQSFDPDAGKNKLDVKTYITLGQMV